MKPVKTLLSMLLLTLMLNACSNSISQSKKYFRLATPPTSDNTEPKPMALAIKRPSALSILGGRPMVATQADGSLIQLSHNFWIESPKVLLRDYLKQWALQHWQSATFSEPETDVYQILETRILAFEKQQTTATVALEFTLYEQDHTLILNQQFESSVPMDGEGYRAFTRAINKAIENILIQLKQQL